MVLYVHVPKGFFGLESEKQTDWKSYFIAQGVKFPKGGFAVYYWQAGILAVATDHEEQMAVASLVDCALTNHWNEHH